MLQLLYHVLHITPFASNLSGNLWKMSNLGTRLKRKNRQHRTIPALRLKHRSGGCGTASALPKCSIMSGCGTRIVLRGQKPLALCDRCPCFGSLFPPLAALTFAASSIICAFGLASAAPRSPYRHLELCGIANKITDYSNIAASRCLKGYDGMTKILFVCHGSILRSLEKACYINGFHRSDGAYYTTITPFVEEL